MELLSVTMNDGVMPRSEIEGKDNSSEDKSNYKVVLTGDMVYNCIFRRFGAGCPACESHRSGAPEPVFRAVRAGIIFCPISAARVFNLSVEGVQQARRQFRCLCAPFPAELCTMTGEVVHARRCHGAR